MKKYIAILVTCPSKKEASKIADKLLKERLVACVNIVDGVKSLFWWKAKIDKTKESLIIAKTVKGNFRKVGRCVKKLHSYEVPEIIAMPIVDGEVNYLKWLDGSVKT